MMTPDDAIDAVDAVDAITCLVSAQPDAQRAHSSGMISGHVTFHHQAGRVEWSKRVVTGGVLEGCACGLGDVGRVDVDDVCFMWVLVWILSPLSLGVQAAGSKA